MSQYATIVTQKAGSRNLPPELDPKNEGFIYGAASPSCWGALNRICLQLRVPTLTNFEQHYEEYGGDDEPKDAGAWHSPSEGIRTVSALLDFLRTATPMQLKPHFSEKFIQDDLQWIVFDLRAYEIILHEAKEQNDPFQISIE